MQKPSKRLRARHEGLKGRIETMYLDELDGRVTQEFFDERAAEWRREQDTILRKIQEA